MSNFTFDINDFNLDQNGDGQISLYEGLMFGGFALFLFSEILAVSKCKASGVIDFIIQMVQNNKKKEEKQSASAEDKV